MPSRRGATAALARVRKICLALPDATEKIAWGEPTFRVRDRLFVMFANNHHNDGRVVAALIEQAYQTTALKKRAARTRNRPQQ